MILTHKILPPPEEAFPTPYTVYMYEEGVHSCILTQLST